MEAWNEDRFNALLQAPSEQALFSLTAELAKTMGFEYCAYGIQTPVPISRPHVAMFNNYSEQWQERYKERGYLLVDPTVQHAFKSTRPLVWTNRLFETAPDLWDEARGHGLKHGWAQATRDMQGTVGLLTLARSAEPLSALELAENQAAMSWLTQFVHASMAQKLIPKLVPETQVRLTVRERDVLRWTAEGKTAYEISQILSISERTINFHINNIVTKLGTTNKTQAAVKAAVLGMLA
ncbi:autoinducer binding domain-containing protein [Noviherbaspirillum saxi]|uniref:LuxR family transcriptional regulator n=1 Tax=Noviherbaspirillum saxi TaxID=2320863 RepID=A0A3A3FHW1_9BURK|nr:autoinducer binding domain-containing protein [Noviherbaspirillum saxi]RJF92104.1 LuxR family transcriptional regulator [Noviherbaspirillum saxi]